MGAPSTLRCPPEQINISILTREMFGRGNPLWLKRKAQPRPLANFTPGVCCSLMRARRLPRSCRRRASPQRARDNYGAS
jgi:hypothetical protein